ncbi:MAG: carbohydrate-binding protein [Phycisphaerae bacterium]|jgi:pectate lyase
MKRAYFLAGFVTILFSFTFSVQAYDSAPIGWASESGGTTGGAGGTTVTVDNVTDFIYYVQGTNQDPYIIYVSGNINLGGSNIRVRGNKTIIGLPGSHITGNLKCYNSEESNNIFRFLDMDNEAGAGDGDCISIDGVQHIWVDHCTFTDGGDGNIDIKNGADYVTVSWCIFQYTYDSGHNFSNLVGHSDDNGGTDMNHLLVTFHHNWYSTLSHERMPSVRFGKAHIYNTYFDCPGNNYCIRTRLYAQCLVENNYFKDVQNPWQRYVTSAGGDPGLLYASGNILDNVTWVVGDDSDVVLIDGTDTVFTPPYSYTLDNAEDIPALVQYGAGVDGQDGYPPHWYFGYYGDFDRSGFVDMNDFAVFANYWGISDCEQLWNVDYNGDCKVDFYELGWMSENWLYIAPDITPPDAPTGLGASAGDAIVSLDWDDNAEEDLAGYNIYRSTTSGSGYTKLNGSLLINSDYTDNSVTNNTTYYYVVTAADTNSNESDYSSEVLAYPSAGSSSVTIQENTAGFCNVEGIIDNKHAGYTGTGFCDTTNAAGTGIDWSVNILTGGTYTFTWRYAHGKTDDRSARLIINGSTVISSITFPPTGAFTTWSTVSADVSLTAGVKSVRLEGITSNSLANIDYINIAGENFMPAGCP